MMGWIGLGQQKWTHVQLCVQDSQHAGRHMLHLSAEVIETLAQSLGWETLRSSICPVISIVFLD